MRVRVTHQGLPNTYYRGNTKKGYAPKSMTYRDTEYLKILGNNTDRVSQNKVNLGPKETC